MCTVFNPTYIENAGDCSCKLCWRAEQRKLAHKRWTDFLQHRDSLVIETTYWDNIPKHFGMYEGELSISIDGVGPVSIQELFGDVEYITDHLRGAEFTVVSKEATPFERTKQVAHQSPCSAPRHDL